MTRIEKILVRVRDTLADPRGERWTDEQLIRLIDEAQKTIALKSKTLRAKTTLPLIPGEATVKLPSDLHKIIRVLDAEQKPIPLFSHEQADKRLGDTWEVQTGDPVKAIIFDKTNTGQLKVYPIPDGGEALYSANEVALASTWNPVEFNSPYGVTVDSGYVGDTFNSPYGVVTDLDYVSSFITDLNGCTGYTVIEEGELNSEFGVLANLEDSLWVQTNYNPLYGVAVEIQDYAMSSPYGTVADFSDDKLNIWAKDGPYGFLVNFVDNALGLTLYYLKKPAEVVDIYTDLEIDSTFDRAIKFYTTAMALRDDKDSQNRAMANEELQFFSLELAEALRDGEQDFTATRTQYQANYIGAFD